MVQATPLESGAEKLPPTYAPPVSSPRAGFFFGRRASVPRLASCRAAL